MGRERERSECSHAEFVLVVLSFGLGSVFLSGGVPITYGFATDMASTSCGCQCKVKNEENMAVALATKGPLAGA